MNIAAIIQARLGSSRLPKKILKDISDVPMLKYLIRRINKSKYISSIVVATTNSKNDDELVRWLKNENIEYFRGSEDDVLNRFFHCATDFKAEIIVRITSDDPFKDPSVIDRAIEIFLESKKYDYVSNTIETSFPEGIDVEVFSYEALKKANKYAHTSYDREHVTPFIIENTNIFNNKNFFHTEDLSNFRLTVDHFEDFELAKKISSHFSNEPLVDFITIVDFLRKNPKIANINSKIKPREYLSNKPENN